MSYAETVHELAMCCMFKDDELVDGQPPEADLLIVEGIVKTFGYHKGRIEENKETLRKLAREIVKDEFLKSEGGGYTFLALPETRDGELWGEQSTAESLLCLCKAAGLAEYCAPREMWSAFPGSVPYVVFDLEG